jgi:antitoxin component YwqK of YwqJK toxin-antitoxin module
MLSLLNNNIIDYILNPYLDYRTDIQYIKQLFKYKFLLKLHLTYEIYKENGRHEIETVLYNQFIIREGYYSNGNLSWKSFHNLFEYGGAQDGNTYSWYENGKMKSVKTFKNGKLEGFEKYFYRNGNLMYKYHYKNSKLDGLQREYYKSGQLFKEIYIEDGKLITIKEYYRNGELKDYFRPGLRYTNWY